MAQIQEATANDGNNDYTNEEKAWLDTYKGEMRGLHEASHTLSAGYQWACLEVQGLVNQSLSLSTEKDRRFIAEASTALCRWVKVVQLVIDCLEKSIAEQSHLLEDAQKVGMEITKEILALYPLEGKKEPIDPSIILRSGPLMQPGSILRRPSCACTINCQCSYTNMYPRYKPVSS